MKAHIYIEGGYSPEDQIRCREAFRALIAKLGFSSLKRMPRLSACGSRSSTYSDFKVASARQRLGEFIALLVDSEDPVADVEKPWEHLKQCDGWEAPPGAGDEHAFLMTTSMETWIVADRSALRKHYGENLQESALPSLHNLEGRDHHEVHDRLTDATRTCSNAYAKGKRSFVIVGKLDPNALKQLPSFARMERILKKRL